MEDIIRITLRQALGKYWPYLLIAAISPLIMVALTQASLVYGNWLVMLTFLSTVYYAGIPYSKYNAPFSYWYVVCVVWLVSMLPATFIVSLIGELLAN